MASTMTIVTVIDHAKLLLREVGGEAFSASQYEDLLLKHCGTSQTWSCAVVIPNKSYAYALAGGFPSFNGGGRSPIYIYTASSTDGTGVMSLQGSSNVYRLNCVGPTVVVSTGTDTRTSIDVTGCQVDFDGYMIELLMALKTHAARARGVSISSATVDIDTTFQRIDKMIQDYRGAVSL